MSKQTRQQRKEEERQIIEQMKAALAEADAQEQAEQAPAPAEQATNQAETSAEPQKRSAFDVTPQVLHCKRCKTEMKNGKCPTCGFEMYVPMSKEKRDKIKLYATIVGMAIFVVIFIITRIK